MRLSSKILRYPVVLLFLLVGNEMYSQSACSGDEKQEKTCASGQVAKDESTVGCKPSSCRGAQTKFNEAQVLTDLRNDLVSLKSTLHDGAIETQGLVGESDAESLELMAREIQSLEAFFSTKFNTTFPRFVLPENKAKQVSFLKGRLQGLQKLL